MIATQLINFIQSELAVPRESIRLALRQSQPTPNYFPLILWQYGLISLAQLEQIFDWLENSN